MACLRKSSVVILNALGLACELDSLPFRLVVVLLVRLGYVHALFGKLLHAYQLLISPAFRALDLLPLQLVVVLLVRLRHACAVLVGLLHASKLLALLGLRSTKLSLQ